MPTTSIPPPAGPLAPPGARPAAGRAGRALDLVVALVLALAAAGVAASIPSPGNFGDHYHVIHHLQAGLESHWALELYASILLGAAFGLTKIQALYAVSSASLGLAVGLLYGLARARRLERVSAGLLALALGATPSLAFFGTVLEVHAIQAAAACAAFGIALGASRLDSLVLRWCGGLLAGALAFVGHPAQLLVIPGLVVLALGNARQARTWGWIAVAGTVVGHLLLGHILPRLDLYERFPKGVDGGGLLTAVLRYTGFILAIPSRLGTYSIGDIAAYVGENWFLRQGLLVPVALVAVAFGRVGGDLRRVVLAAGLPYLIIAPLFGVREMGGYMMAMIPLSGLVLASALAQRSRWLGRGLCLALLVAQLLLARQLLQGYARYGSDPQYHAEIWEIAEAIPSERPAERRLFVLTPSMARHAELLHHVGIIALNLRFALDAVPSVGLVEFQAEFERSVDRALDADLWVLIDEVALQEGVPGSEKLERTLPGLLSKYRVVELPGYGLVRRIVALDDEAL